MRVLYNILLSLLHIVGFVILAALCMARWVWGASWTLANELDLILYGAIVYGLHYILLFIGHKKGFTERKVIRMLQVVEFVLFLPQIVFLFGFTISKIIHFSFPVMEATKEVLPTFVTFLVIFAIRKWSYRFCSIGDYLGGRRQGDGSPVSAENDPIDPE